MSGDFDELENVADQNDVHYDGRSRTGRKLGKGERCSRKAQSRGRFKRIKKKPVTLASLPIAPPAEGKT